MKISRTVLFFADSPIYGGHEAMFVQHLLSLSLAERKKVIVVVARENAELQRRLASFAQGAHCVRIRRISAASRLDQFTALVRINRLKALLAIIREEKPDVICTIAGRIEAAHIALVAGKVSRIPVVGYLPMVHFRTEMKAGVVSWFRDQVNRLSYASYSGIICITPAQKAELLRRGISNVEVIENRIPCVPVLEAKRPRGDLITVGYLGRIAHEQKNVFQIIRVAEKASQLGLGLRFVICGSGPDKQRLVDECKRKKLLNVVEVLDWMSDVTPFFEKIDVLAIPSRYEGVPLVMLEALARGVPVIGTWRDGMRDWLPRDWCFAFDDDEQFLRVLEKRPFENFEAVREVMERVRSRCFICGENEFPEAIGRLLERLNR